jgi:hypothetical protein
MKKLLALILCVMMFVSVMSTAAFADVGNPDVQRKWEGSTQSKDIVEALRNNVQNIYGSLAADQVIYDSMKSTNTMINDLVDEMLKEYRANSAYGTGTSKTTIRDAIRAGIKSAVGGTVSDYLNGHTSDYISYDKWGNAYVDAVKYASVYGKALSKALSSEDAVNGIQAYYMYAAQRAAYEDMATKAGSLKINIGNESFWKDYGFDIDTTTNRAFETWGVPGAAVNNVNDPDGLMTAVVGTVDGFLNTKGLLGADIVNDDLIRENESAVTFTDPEGTIVPVVYPQPQDVQ